MFKDGQTFNIDGREYCVLKEIDYNNKKYVLFSIEDDKLAIKFYEVVGEEEENIRLDVVTDDLEFILFDYLKNKFPEEFDYE